MTDTLDMSDTAKELQRASETGPFELNRKDLMRLAGWWLSAAPEIQDFHRKWTPLVVAQIEMYLEAER